MSSTHIERPSAGATDVPAPPRVTAADAARIAANVVLPTLAGGVIMRRRGGMALAERFQWDQRGIDTVRELRERYGDGPLWMRPAGRSVAFLLDPADMERTLEGTPEPFTPATREKRGALSQFQPHGSLISRGGSRPERRLLNERALEMAHPLHHLAPAVVGRVREEAGAVAEGAAATGELTWDDFASGWWRSVRRIVLGEGARDDETLVRQLERLRTAANWSAFAPRRMLLRSAFQHRLRAHADRAEQDTLAAAAVTAAEVSGAEAATTGTDPVEQVPHWLFAFDAAAIVTLRTLALLATHTDEAARARGETAGVNLGEPQELPYLRACVMESVRLWPTTPLLLRESTEAAELHGQGFPSRTTCIAYTPYFHRGDPAGEYGDTFTPDIWLDGRAGRNPALVPFSAGPGKCPGENVVLLTATTWLAALLEGNSYELLSRVRPGPGGPLPATVNHFALRFGVRRVQP